MQNSMSEITIICYILTPTYQLHKGHEEGFGNSITRGCHGNIDFVFFKVLLQIGLLKR